MLTCDFTDLVTGEPIVFEVPMLIVDDAQLLPGLNQITIANGLSDAFVVLLQGTQAGSQVVPIQGQQLHTGLADAVPVALAEVDVDGVATVFINVPASQFGQTLLFQAFQVLPEVEASDVVSFVVGAGTLLASGGEGPGAAAVSPTVLPALIEEAIGRWESAGISSDQLDQVRSATIQLVDLPGGLLSKTRGNTISVDTMGAGYGWFVDSTPGADEEFPVVVAATESQVSAESAASGRMDLLTALMHEFGHILGLPDLQGPTHDLMASTLPVGVRRYQLPVLGSSNCVVGNFVQADADEPNVERVRSCRTVSTRSTDEPLDMDSPGTTDSNLATASTSSDEPIDMDSTDARPLNVDLAVTTLSTSVWQNPASRMDVNNDGSVSALDALVGINELNDPKILGANGRLPGARPENVAVPFFDVNGDGFGTPVDVVSVINELNGRFVGEGESKAAANSVVPVSVAWNGMPGLDQRFAMARRDLQSALAISPHANAHSRSNENWSPARRAVTAVHALNAGFLAWYSDRTIDDGLESILDEIAGDVWEHWPDDILAEHILDG